MYNSKLVWFNKLLASVWLVSVLFLTLGVNYAFASDMRNLQGKLGLLRRPIASAVEWKIDRYIDSLFSPVQANAQFGGVVTCVNCATEAGMIAERLEVTLLRSLLTAFVRTILNFIQDTVLTIIRQLTSAQDQFNFLRSIGQYAEQAVLLASKQAYNCANNSITNWTYNLFGDTPPDTAQDNCKFGVVNVENPNENDVIAATQDVIDQCVALAYSATLPIGCTDTEIKQLQSQSEEVLKEKLLNECTEGYTPPLFEELSGAYSCGGYINEGISRFQQESLTRSEEVGQAVSRSLDSFNQSIGDDAAFITTDAPGLTTISDNSAETSEFIASPVYYPTSLDIFDPNTNSLNEVRVGFAKDPKADELINDYTIAGINSKPEPSGEPDKSIINTIQDSFKGFLDQLLNKLQEMLFSFLNNLIAKLDVATGGSGIFSSLLSDITGSVKTYAKSKVDSLYRDITEQRQALVDDLGQRKEVITYDDNVTFVP
ncbi:MAG: hypothetical protein AAGF07_00715 [Patescibacteria group bacterium]